MKYSWAGGLGLLVCVVVLSFCPADAGGQPAGKAKKGTPRDEASVWMTKKLEFSQKILAGLTQGDFALVRKNADAMLVVGYLEKWDRARLPEYRKQLRLFEDSNKALLRAADHRDIKGATRAYAQLVISCVECHNVVRDVQGKR